MDSTGLVALPPGSAPDEPRAPQVAIADILAVVRDEPLGVAEVREVVPADRWGAPVAVKRDACPPVPAVALELVYDLMVALRRVGPARVLPPAECLVSLTEGLHDQRPLAAGVVEDTPD